jgi:curved DNA-binding protein CbpA
LKDYYQILRLKRTATELEIKKQYRKLALELHPDKNPAPSATQKFIELTESYEVLSNKNRRNHYDELLAFEEQQIRVKEQQRKRWEQEVNQASQRGRTKGKKFAEDFNYFSKKVLTETALKLFLEILLGMIFGDINSWLTLSFLLTIAGIIVFILNWGTVGLMALGAGMTVLGLLWFRREVRREYET